MSSIIHLGVLLIISAVIAEPGSFPHLSYLKHELEMLTLGVPGYVMDWHQEHHSQTAPLSASPKWQRNPVLCCVCQDVIKQTRPKIDSQIQTKLNQICSMFILSVKMKCLRRGGALKYKLLNKIFPGRTPKDTCQKVKLCMY